MTSQSGETPMLSPLLPPKTLQNHSPMTTNSPSMHHHGYHGNFFQFPPVAEIPEEKSPQIKPQIVPKRRTLPSNYAMNQSKHRSFSPPALYRHHASVPVIRVRHYSGNSPSSISPLCSPPPLPVKSGRRSSLKSEESFEKVEKNGEVPKSCENLKENGAKKNGGKKVSFCGFYVKLLHLGLWGNKAENYRVVTLPGKPWNLKNFEKKNLVKPGI